VIYLLDAVPARHSPVLLLRHVAGMFRILRDSEVEIDEEAVDLVRTFETALKRRRRGHVISLVVDTQMPSDLVRFLMERFDVRVSNASSKLSVFLKLGRLYRSIALCSALQLDDMFLVDDIVGVGDVKQIIQDERPDLLFAPYVPRFPERIRCVISADLESCVRALEYPCRLRHACAVTLVAMCLLRFEARTSFCT
jgi:polyphosphate kinase